MKFFVGKIVFLCACLVSMINSVIVFTGTYQSGQGGIVVYDLNSDTGALTQLSVAPSSSPSYLSVHPNGKFLYATNEGSPGSFQSFSIGVDNGLTSLNTVSSKGDYPAHLSVHSSGKWLFGTNYNTGNFLVYSLGNDGKIATEPTENITPGSGSGKAHQIFTAPNGEVVGVDLGSNAVFFWTFNDSTGKLTLVRTIDLPVGAGPRHAVYGKNTFYVLGEKSQKVYTYKISSSDGSYTLLSSVSTLPENPNGVRASAELRISPNGKFLYASNRYGQYATTTTHGDIAMFSISETNGNITSLGNIGSQGSWPRGMNIDSAGKWVLVGNHFGNNVAVYEVETNGKLTYQGQVSTDSPVDFAFLQLPPVTSDTISVTSGTSASSIASSTSSSNSTTGKLCSGQACETVTSVPNLQISASVRIPLASLLALVFVLLAVL